MTRTCRKKGTLRLAHLWIYNWCFTYRDLLHQPLLTFEERTGWRLFDLYVLQVPNACLSISHKPLLLQRKIEVITYICQTVWSWKRQIIAIYGEWWIILSPNHPQAQERPTFVLADLLDPGEGVYLHQRVWDADDVHHVHDTLKPTMNTRGKKRGWNTRGGGLTVLMQGKTSKPGLSRQKIKHEHFKEVLRLTNTRGALGGQADGWLKWDSVLLGYTLVQSFKTKWPLRD